jgi:hypothetical protein
MNGNTESVGSSANGFLLTDDVYGDTNPTPFLGGQLYVPEWSFGRLVETPADIANQIDAFIAANGTITPTSATLAGYDFLSDGTRATSAALAPTIPNRNESLIRDDWSKADILGAVFSGTPPTLAVVNAHYDHRRLLPARNNALQNQTETLSTSEATAFARILLTVGCHSGYTVADGVYPLDAAFALDWAQRAAQGGTLAYVGQAGYGLGDSAVVGYSETLQVELAKRLGQMSLGEALAYAKQQYVADLAVPTSYDQKVVNEAVFYGLPQWRLGSATPPVPPAPLPTTTDATTGLLSAAFSSTPASFPLQHAPNGGGDYYTAPNGAVQVTNGRPFEPRVTLDVSQPDTTAHGALITSLASTSETGFRAARSRVVDDNAADAPPLTSSVASLS